MGASAARAVVRGAGRGVGRAGGLPAGALELIREVAEFVTFVQREKTKRTAIRVRRDVLVARIQSETAMIEAHLDGAFQTRALVFNSLLGLYRIALQNGLPHEAAEKILEAITLLAREDPIANAVQACRQTH